MSGGIKSLLLKTGSSTAASLRSYYPRVRDRDDIEVLRCDRSGAIVLRREDHINPAYYANKTEGVWGQTERMKALAVGRNDTERRAEAFRSLISGKRWLDVGTGSGGILDALSPCAGSVVAVEPQDSKRAYLVRCGYEVYASVEDVPDLQLEVVSLFHVFEHLTDPVGLLDQLRAKMELGSHLVIEVPHARDALLSTYDCEAFRAFTLWSEHLILHTRQTLKAFIESSGFSLERIEGVQRYPLANHLYWLSNGKPGGQAVWPELVDEELNAAYARILCSNDASDTLVAIATAV
ncbi:class I SAM-dependent methyltransferase [Motiliproteus sediminis]|uniref:class I SAM-dependent methyltransferase n=1 Tax=Motiliproteus sediminis TaxID=1468178 RepID=UPI001AEFE6FC|nr:class I SAM-dependent methyltransferase [Motiliproteus sediminis]